MKILKFKKSVMINLKLVGLVTILLYLFTNVSYAKSVKFIKNSVDSCIIEPYKDAKSGGFIINGNKQELFYRTEERGFIYYISKKGPGRIDHANTKDTAVFAFTNYKVKEYKGQIFVKDNIIGTAKKGDFIILWSDGKVRIYNGKYVRIGD